MNSFRHCVGWIAFVVVACAGPVEARAHVVADEMAAAANRFLNSLRPEQKAKAAFEFRSEERENWHYIPKDRKGLPFKEMTSEQRKFALELLASGLSRHGLEKATNIMSLESVLAELEGPNRRFLRDPELYYVSVFGPPKAAGTWSWRVEGHHFSANFSLVEGKFFASTPSFLGTNPAEVRKGPRTGLRVLAAEEDLARKLVRSLNDQQRKSGIISTTAPKEIITEAQKRVKAIDQAGIAHANLQPDQQQLLMQIVEEYVNRTRPELAKADLARIQEAGVGQLRFAWAGGLERGEGHYYRIQGPTFLLEYDNTQNDNNHIHAVWRDFKNDFGEDLLRQHYRDVPHPN